MYKWFQTAASEKDYIDETDITQLCAYLETFLEILESSGIEYDLDCNNITYNPNIDSNMNGKVGFNEFIEAGTIAVIDSGYEIYSRSIDCSACLNNASKYWV